MKDTMKYLGIFSRENRDGQDVSRKTHTNISLIKYDLQNSIKK